jgi:hypothetical protein
MIEPGAINNSAAVRTRRISSLGVSALLMLAMLQCAGCYISDYAERGRTVQIWSAPEQVLVARDGSVAIRFLDSRIHRMRYLVATPEVFRADLQARAWHKDGNTYLDLAPGSVELSSWRLVPAVKRAPDAAEADLHWASDFIIARYGPAERVSTPGRAIFIRFDYKGGEAEARTVFLSTECITHRKTNSLVMSGAILADVITSPIQALYLFGRFCYKVGSGRPYS